MDKHSSQAALVTRKDRSVLERVFGHPGEYHVSVPSSISFDTGYFYPAGEFDPKAPADIGDPVVIIIVTGRGDVDLAKEALRLNEQTGIPVMYRDENGDIVTEEKFCE